MKHFKKLVTAIVMKLSAWTGNCSEMMPLNISDGSTLQSGGGEICCACCCCDLEYYVKTTSDNRSRDTDSLTNFFECPDVSSHIAEKHEEQIADDGSTSRPLKTEEEDAAASFTITTETDDRQIVREESDTRAENTEERKVSEERDLCHEDDGKLLESQEVEENETIELEEAERTGRNDSCHHLEEQSGTGVPSTDSVARETHTSDDLPTCGPTEIPGVHYENDQVSPAGRQLIEAVEPRLDEVRTTVETSDAETPLEVKTQDSESANPAVPALSTTSPDAVGKIGDDVQLVSTNGLDAVVVEERAADEELGLADQPDFEPRTVDKSPEKASSPEQPADIEEASVRLDQLKSVADAFAAVEPSGAETPLEVEQRVSEPLSIAVPTLITTSPDVLGNTGDDIHLVSNSVLEAVKIEEVAANGELSAAEPYGTEESHVHLDNVESVIDASVADAADDEDVGKMASREPAAQSVLSARDVFIEQQVSTEQIITVSVSVPLIKSFHVRLFFYLRHFQHFYFFIRSLLFNRSPQIIAHAAGIQRITSAHNLFFCISHDYRFYYFVFYR